jgi:hypothetical protein
MGSFENKISKESLDKFLEGKAKSKFELMKEEAQEKIKKGTEDDPKVELERKEERDRYSFLRNELREMKRGGTDFHFALIDVDKLSNQALDLFEAYKRKKPALEKSIREFMGKSAEESDDFQFAAMIGNWTMRSAEKEKAKEREALKEQAIKKVSLLKRVNPDIEQYLEEINFDLLRRLDYEAIIKLDSLHLRTYEANLQAYFRNKRKKDNMTGELQHIDPRVIENDQSYKNYEMLCNILNQHPFNPDIINK